MNAIAMCCTPWATCCVVGCAIAANKQKKQKEKKKKKNQEKNRKKEARTTSARVQREREQKHTCNLTRAFFLWCLFWFLGSWSEELDVMHV